ncbi:MAG: hypothetical protein ACI85O_003940 [Saprospiraceae bacterium]|jgi:hypothetical protein
MPEWQTMEKLKNEKINPNHNSNNHPKFSPN